MCGICGGVGIGEEGLLESMTAALIHRGPDGEGFYRDRDVGLGHRRLSIIDVEGGQQPILNEDGSVALICNGEIYNHAPLRQELLDKGHVFRTHSDNEVVLHLYEESGPDCLQRLNGMFAVAIYEQKPRRLFVARDRLGIKPLYIAPLPGRFLFASEMKSILRDTSVSWTVNPLAVRDYLSLRYVPGPGGMFREIDKLPAGHYAMVAADGTADIHRWWEPPLHASPFEGSEQDYIDGFAERFERSVERRLMSEVPFGAYLSGGLDSSTIVAAMSRIVSTPVRTFSVGFDYEHDELEAAAETARRCGCDHTEVACRLTDLTLLPEIVYHLDEPVGDPIVIPMYMLAREAKKKVTVILTGEGADEVFGGYLFHKALLDGHRIARIAPGWLHRTLLASLVQMAPASLLNMAFNYPARLGSRGKQKVVDFVRLLGPEHLAEAWRHLISLYDERDMAGLFSEDFEHSFDTFSAASHVRALSNASAGNALGGRSRSNGASQRSAAAGTPFLNRIIDLQFDHWLPDDILTKQDKMSMASAIEGRVPFLDHELVEYGLRLPPSMKIRGSSTKHILRRYAERLLPQETARRRKMPFYAPVEKFFREPGFQEIMNDTLSESTVARRGIFRPQAVRELRQAMNDGEFLRVKQVFSLIVLELWFRMAVDRHGSL